MNHVDLLKSCLDIHIDKSYSRPVESYRYYNRKFQGVRERSICIKDFEITPQVELNFTT